MRPADVVGRVWGRASGRLVSLPILALAVHSRCNCRCVMCDIWKANAVGREISEADLERHAADIARLRVGRVMLTGGEPLLHANLWRLCARLRAGGTALTLVTTGLLVERHAADIAQYVDQLVVSIDGPPDVHDAIRRVPGGFSRIASGLARLRQEPMTPAIVARSVVQRANAHALADTIEAVRDAGAGRLSFLAADVSSPAFNRQEPWDEERRSEIALGEADLQVLAAAIARAEHACARSLDAGFVVGGLASLRRIHAYYRGLLGLGPLPAVRCNAPWVSAVLEPGGTVRPCFFHEAYPAEEGGLKATLNGPAAVAFRRGLRTRDNETCRRCVCSLSLPVWRQDPH